MYNNQIKKYLLFSSCVDYDNTKVPPTENVPCSTENIPCLDENIPCSTENIPCLDENIPCSTENIPLEKVVEFTSNIYIYISNIGIYIMVSQNMFVPQLLYNLLVIYIL